MVQGGLLIFSRGGQAGIRVEVSLGVEVIESLNLSLNGKSLGTGLVVRILLRDETLVAMLWCLLTVSLNRIFSIDEINGVER